MSSIARTTLRTPLRLALTGPIPRATSLLSARNFVTQSLPAQQRIYKPAQFQPLIQGWNRSKSTDAKNWGPPIVKYEELKPLTEQPTDDIVLIDVREPDEVALGSIPSSVNLPLSVLPTHLATTFSPGTFLSSHGFSKPLPSQKIIFFCRSGKRSANAAELAGKEGYVNVRNYEGSWLDWVKREKESGSGGKGGSKWDDDD